MSVCIECSSQDIEEIDGYLTCRTCGTQQSQFHFSDYVERVKTGNSDRPFEGTGTFTSRDTERNAIYGGKKHHGQETERNKDRQRRRVLEELKQTCDQLCIHKNIQKEIKLLLISIAENNQEATIHDMKYTKKKFINRAMAAAIHFIAMKYKLPLTMTEVANKFQLTPRELETSIDTMLSDIGINKSATTVSIEQLMRRTLLQLNFFDEHTGQPSPPIVIECISSLIFLIEKARMSSGRRPQSLAAAGVWLILMTLIANKQADATSASAAKQVNMDIISNMLDVSTITIEHHVKDMKQLLVKMAKSSFDDHVGNHNIRDQLHYVLPAVKSLYKKSDVQSLQKKSSEVIQLSSDDEEESEDDSSSDSSSSDSSDIEVIDVLSSDSEHDEAEKQKLIPPSMVKRRQKEERFKQCVKRALYRIASAHQHHVSSSSNMPLDRDTLTERDQEIEDYLLKGYRVEMLHDHYLHRARLRHPRELQRYHHVSKNPTLSDDDLPKSLLETAFRSVAEATKMRQMLENQLEWQKIELADKRPPKRVKTVDADQAHQDQMIREFLDAPPMEDLRQFVIQNQTPTLNGFAMTSNMLPVPYSEHPPDQNEVDDDDDFFEDDVEKPTKPKASSPWSSDEDTDDY